MKQNTQNPYRIINIHSNGSQKNANQYSAFQDRPIDWTLLRHHFHGITVPRRVIDDITVAVIPSCPVGANTELSCLVLSVSTITVVLLESWLHFAMDVYTCNKKKIVFTQWEACLPRFVILNEKEGCNYLLLELKSFMVNPSNVVGVLNNHFKSLLNIHVPGECEFAVFHFSLAVVT